MCVWVCGCMNVQYECMDVGVCGCVRVWMDVYVGLWVYGCRSVWMYVYMGV